MIKPIIETPVSAEGNACRVAQAWRQWLATPLGRYLRDWEQAQLDAAVVDVFGYHAVQLDTPELKGLQSNRMPYRWYLRSCTEQAAADAPWPLAACDLVAEGAGLPFEAASLDLVVMPHTLELCEDPHATLREAERVLVPEGQLVITGLNPVSLWGWHNRRKAMYQRLGWRDVVQDGLGHLIGYWRLRDWLRLLGFEVQVSRFGCWRPAVQNTRWLARMAWLDRWGARWWPILGGAYMVVAVKRVPGGRMLGRAWKKAPVRVGAALPAAQRHHAVQPHVSSPAVQPQSEFTAQANGKLFFGSR
jgi:SAM-dependent methyltransferase